MPLQPSCVRLLVLTLGLCGAAHALAGVPAANCPLAGQAFSLDASLFDLITHPEAKLVVDRLAPGFVDSLPSEVTGRTLPALAAIVSLRMVGTGKLDDATLASMDRALHQLPVTAEADRLRCARYDGGAPPRLSRITRRPAILVFDKSTGFRDLPSVEAAAAALRKMAHEKGWQLVFTDRPAVFNRHDLARFDAVIWNNVSGDVLTLRQRAAFKAYVEQGGGYAGIHGSNGDPLTYWDWYSDTLIGARFMGHPAAPQFQDAKVVVEDRKNPVTAGLGDGWTMKEEWYSFSTNPRATGARVLATLDESSYKPVALRGDISMGDHPIAWTRCVGKGRSFYTAIGHRPESYTHPFAARLLGQGIEWAVVGGRKDCSGALAKGS